MVKTTEAVVTEKRTDAALKKKKRPWRDKVRKKARKEAQRANRAITVLDKAIPSLVESKKKKKKRKRKKNVSDNDEPTSKAVTDSAKNVVQEGYKKLESGRFRFLNEQLYTMSGSEALDYFREDPDAFRCYHSGFAEQVKKWPTHPLDVIIRWLKVQPKQRVVLDLGCGDAKIADAVGELHKVHSYDLVAVNEKVTACDMAHLPLEDACADIVIFCLSLMGTNLADYIREARRVLKIGGVLKIAEVLSRFVNVKLFCVAVCKLGFSLIEKKQLTDYFTLLEFHKIEKVENKRPFGLKLKPCLYKKR
ncbi:unnamed protein product [Cylicocyclus nassatus]|uniref:Ribosomal RNA-processing protein 8 n=1 Tax=Cylicocyclus nassatus TaxID=53992 RepID=A0AA36H2U0_CYLNA|nr:unnamed protein product [Cylicocyclus nassatus]